MTMLTLKSIIVGTLLGVLFSLPMIMYVALLIIDHKITEYHNRNKWKYFE